jgi:hypothetical protein
VSDHWIQFVPADPNAQPTKDAAERAVQLLSSCAPRADKVSFELKENTEFFSGLGNLSDIQCPACGVDVEHWWRGAMDRAWQTLFRDLAVTTPCCGSQTSLNDLRYIWPAAFGRFVLEAMNPDIGNTTAEQDDQLAKCLGLPLRKVLAHL